jgi:hypothetical protein
MGKQRKREKTDKKGWKKGQQERRGTANEEQQDEHGTWPTVNNSMATILTERKLRRKRGRFRSVEEGVTTNSKVGMANRIICR